MTACCRTKQSALLLFNWSDQMAAATAAVIVDACQINQCYFDTISPLRNVDRDSGRAKRYVRRLYCGNEKKPRFHVWPVLYARILWQWSDAMNWGSCIWSWHDLLVRVLISMVRHCLVFTKYARRTQGKYTCNIALLEAKKMPLLLFRRIVGFKVI